VSLLLENSPEFVNRQHWFADVNHSVTIRAENREVNKARLCLSTLRKWNLVVALGKPVTARAIAVLPTSQGTMDTTLK